MLGEVPVRGVDYLQQDVGARYLLQRGPEGVHELVGQLVDEAYRVRDDCGLAFTQLHLARGWVHGREQPVLGLYDDLPDQRVEERRLAGVGIPDDRNGRD